MSLESFVNHFVKALPAAPAGQATGQPITVSVQGNSFLVANVRGGNGHPIEVSLEDRPWFAWQQGLRFRTVNRESFKKLSFRNTQNVELEIEFYVTNGEIDDARLNIVRDPNQLQIITQFPAPTYAVREYPDALPALQDPEDATNKIILPGVLIRGVWPCAPAANWQYALPSGVNRAQRKSLRIETDEPLDVLWWNGALAGVGAGVKLGSAPMPDTTVPFYEETSQDIVLVNPGAAAATIAILALFDVPVWFSLTSEDP